LKLFCAGNGRSNGGLAQGGPGRLPQPLASLNSRHRIRPISVQRLPLRCGARRFPGFCGWRQRGFCKVVCRSQRGSPHGVPAPGTTWVFAATGGPRVRMIAAGRGALKSKPQPDPVYPQGAPSTERSNPSSSNGATVWNSSVTAPPTTAFAPQARRVNLHCKNNHIGVPGFILSGAGSKTCEKYWCQDQDLVSRVCRYVHGSAGSFGRCQKPLVSGP